jgi:hypothetical protein
MMLSSFVKKLFKNEGISDESDDVFRQIYVEQRKKIKEILISRPEV